MHLDITMPISLDQPQDTMDPLDGFGDPAPKRSKRDEALAKLEIARRKKAPATCPDRMPLASIKTATEALGVRGEELTPHHLEDLLKALEKAGKAKDLDAIMVMATGSKAVVVDGHHRLEAYRRAGRLEIPVIYFDGTPEEALLHACRIGGKAVLPLTNQQRQNLAWELVVMGQDRFSKATISENTGVSTSQVANMRKARKQLGDEAVEIASWWKAQRLAKGDAEGSGEMTDEELDARAADLAKKIHNEVGPRFARSPDLAARTLVKLIGGTRIRQTIAAMAILVDLDGEELDQLIHDEDNEDDEVEA